MITIFVKGGEYVDRETYIKTKDENTRLREACQSMLETTGGSKHWNGSTRKSLLLIEEALDSHG